MGRARPWLFSAAGLLALAVLLVALLTSAPTSPPASPSPATGQPSPSAPPTATTSATPSPTPAGMFEDQILGYRITLPDTYRRARSAIITRHPELLGRDTYTFRSERDEREDCLRDRGGIPSPSDAE